MLDTLRISATDLDAIRYFHASEDADPADLLAQLRRELPPTPAMERGTAFHDALEQAQEGKFETFDARGYTFDFSGLAATVALPPLREIKATRNYEIDGCLVTLVGKADAIHGRTGYDHKLTSRFDPDRYLSGYQWRVYCEVFGLDEFVWNVFTGSENAGGVVMVRSMDQVRASRYPGIEDDVRAELSAAVGFFRHHMPDRIGRAAA